MSNSEDFQDTGMTSVFYQGVNSERERIIKLLESQSHDLLFQEHETSSCCLCTHLRLIRGEQIANSAKKLQVAERTLAERKFCEVDQFYYSEMFTCPICYGAEQEQERVLQIIDFGRHKPSFTFSNLISLIKGENK